ncbi:class I SAM-dependent methyltransferase [Spiractinospora alimapuensis]|uniref:class I SAM-dependent methyltransferase n=1 Tax=Spiractinospora alimapuensis TaxID=2820884 RepID=UPI001F48EB82|nr:class I SAM-dependent methyltransferase [Spiractinospora alimapuensis]QVQ50853.1 class I SAM-dependent methyltransferase [Spiractinospora alimapuensis]
MAEPQTPADIPAELAATWIERWDAQQEGYIPDREERFAVQADAVAQAVAGVDNPVIVDLGCGPGSLTARLAQRLPRATFIGIDANGLLLALARAHYGEIATWVHADLGQPGWEETLPETIHAAVSSTALHWMDGDALSSVYETLAARTAPGGIFANADHLPLPDERLSAIADAVAVGRQVRTETGEREGWKDWWTAVLADETLAAWNTTAGRPDKDQHEAAGAEHHHGTNELSAQAHVDRLLSAGYRSAGPIWQAGDDHILVALR